MILLDANGKPYASSARGTLGGHRRSKIYGRLDCRSALAAIARGGYVTQRVFFLDEPTARAGGYRPCSVCLPREYAAWKLRVLEAQRVGEDLRDRLDGVLHRRVDGAVD